MLGGVLPSVCKSSFMSSPRLPRSVSPVPATARLRHRFELSRPEREEVGCRSPTTAFKAMRGHGRVQVVEHRARGRRWEQQSRKRPAVQCSQRRNDHTARCGTLSSRTRRCANRLVEEATVSAGYSGVSGIGMTDARSTWTWSLKPRKAEWGQQISMS